MKDLFRYLKYYRKESVLAPLFKLCEALLELFVPLVVASVIDVGIANGDRGYVLRCCLGLLALGVVGLGFSVTAQYFASRAAVGSVAKLKSALFGHVQSLSYAELDSLGTATLITRLTSDANQVQTGVNLTLRLLLRSPFVVFGAMIMAFTVDVRAAVIFAVVIPALSLVVFGIMLLTLPLYKQVQQRLDAVLLKARENLTGVRVLRAFRKEEDENADFCARNDALTALQKRVGRLSALLGPLTYVLLNVAIIALLQTGAARINGGDLTQGQMVALYNYMSQILVELIKLANLILNVTRSVASAKRIGDVFAVRSSLADGVCTAAPDDVAVEFRGVSLRYAEGAENALTDVSFTVRRGETVGVIGGTGSGKTSLVNLIPRFYEATAGSVLVDGVAVDRQTLASLRAKVGVVPQKAALFQGTVAENLRWGDANADDGALYAALECAQARDVVDEKGGLDFALEQEGRNLSGGQKQRLTIARALVKRPPILLLDDAASALDFATDAALRKALAALPWRPTVFLVSQRAASVMHADTILVLDGGRLVGQGPHDELLRTCEVYREIYDSQFRKEGA